MIDEFGLKVLLSFITGALWITIITIITEKYGAKLGSIIIGLPSTVVVTLFFIAYTQTPEIAVESSTITPILIGLNNFVIIIYIILSKRNFLLSIITPIIFWLSAAILWSQTGLNDFNLSLIIFALLFMLALIIFKTKLKQKHHKIKQIKYNSLKLISRALLCGTVISIGVILGKYVDPLWGGTLAAFPVIFLSTIIIMHIEHGNKFASSLLRTAVLTASINMTLYIITVRWLYPIMNFYLATLICFSISLIIAYIFFVYLNNKK